MHCNRCGALLNPNSRFCDQCGAPALDVEETRIARPPSSIPAEYDHRDTEVESLIFTVRPTLLFIKLGYAAAVIAAILLTVVLAIIDVRWYLSLPIALAFLVIPAYYHLRRNMIRYTVTDSKVEIDHGLVAKTTRNIPLTKIQDVTVSSSVMQRILGFGDIVIDNASEIGGTTVLHNINSPRHYADLLLRQLRRRH
jgi:uncharacterized membrane protein YdbT with pleckstrin-like domain